MLVWIRIVLLFTVAEVLNSENNNATIVNFKNKDGETFSKVDDRAVSESKVLKWNELVFVLTGFVLILMAGFAVIFCWIKLKMKTKQLTEAKSIIKLLHGRTSALEDEDVRDPLQILYDKKWELENHSFCIDHSKILGCGEFGIVYKGTIAKLGVDVAFKGLKSQGNMTYLTSLVSELKLLVYIGKHRNIVEFLGAYTREIKKGILYVAIEFCSHGSLKSHLRSNKELFQRCEVLMSYFNNSITVEKYELTDSSNYTIRSLLKWCAEISLGMDFLYHKKIVHRDLAARNILLAEDWTAKLTDFGLSRKLYTSDEYVKKGEDPLPWKWLALESLITNIFSVKTDVWAFGILVWEIFSFGATPYPGLSASKEFATELENGLRNSKPKYASKELFVPYNKYEVMSACWNCDADGRPSFASLSYLFQNAFKHPSRQVNVDDLEPMGQLECENIQYLDLEELKSGNIAKDDLTKQWMSIAKNIINLDHVLLCLIQFEIISEDDSRIIKCEMTDSSRSFKLLSLILQKDWSSVKNVFLDILRMTNNVLCVQQIERFPMTIDGNQQSIVNIQNETTFKESYSSTPKQPMNTNAYTSSNGVQFSKRCMCCCGIVISILIIVCSFVLLITYLTYTKNSVDVNVSETLLNEKFSDVTWNGNFSDITPKEQRTRDNKQTKLNLTQFKKSNDGNKIKKDTVLAYLKSITGSKTIAGVYYYSNKTAGLEKIKRISGVLPAILTTRMHHTSNIDIWQLFIQKTISDWNERYLVHLRFHHDLDIFNDGNDTSWNDLIDNGKETNKLWKKQLDNLAFYIRQLQSAGVVPIVDPLPVINSDSKMYLWGGRAGLNGSLKLYQITKDYLTHHHGLTSLVWSWSIDIGRATTRFEDFWPGKNYVDVASFVMTGHRDYNGNEYAKLLNLVEDKPMSMELVKYVPSITRFTKQSRYTWFTIDESYLKDVSFDENSKLNITFNSPSVINHGNNPFFIDNLTISHLQNY